jgi:hypothetical protein
MKRGATSEPLSATSEFVSATGLALALSEAVSNLRLEPGAPIKVACIVLGSSCPLSDPWGARAGNPRRRQVLSSDREVTTRFAVDFRRRDRSFITCDAKASAAAPIAGPDLSLAAQRRLPRTLQPAPSYPRAWAAERGLVTSPSSALYSPCDPRQAGLTPPPRATRHTVPPRVVP